MKIAILNDTHCGARNSAEWFFPYQAKFYDLFWKEIDKHNIEYILHLGDYFENRKTGASVLAKEQNWKVFVKPFLDREMSMNILVGNHDVYYKNTNTLSSLDDYFRNVQGVNIIKKCSEFDKLNNFLDFSVIPWINEENYSDVLSFIENDKSSVCFGHFEFTGFPFQLNGNVCLNGIDPSLFSKYKSVYSGHFHTKSKKGNVTYLGSQMEFTWADCNDPKFFHIYDTKTKIIEPVRNPYKLHFKIRLPHDLTTYERHEGFYRIFTDDENEKYAKDIIKDLENIALDIKVIKTSTTVIEQNNQQVNISADTQDIIERYIDDFDNLSLDKTKLRDITLDFYRKALSV